MSAQKRLPGSVAVFLLIIGGGADASKIALDALFGVGFILDPLLITPVTTMIFWITLNHNDIPMFSGKFGTAAWVNEMISLAPGIDALPDWTAYTIYLIVNNRASDFTQGIMN